LPVLTQPAGPRILERTAPEYTDEARIARLEGSALVTLVVGDDATLRDVHITRPIGLGLDEKAVEAVKDWHFAPATQGEHPVQAVARVEVGFRLLIGRDDWYLSRATFETPAGATRPVLLSADYPEVEKSAAGGAVTVSFNVDARGVPSGIRVEKSTDEKSANDVEQFLSRWRFHPAVSGGHPVSASAKLTFAHGQQAASE
jgi:TonB family protein